MPSNSTSTSNTFDHGCSFEIFSRPLRQIHSGISSRRFFRGNNFQLSFYSALIQSDNHTKIHKMEPLKSLFQLWRLGKKSRQWKIMPLSQISSWLVDSLIFSSSDGKEASCFLLLYPTVESWLCQEFEGAVCLNASISPLDSKVLAVQPDYLNQGSSSTGLAR